MFTVSNMSCRMGTTGGQRQGAGQALREWAVPTVGLMLLGALTTVVWVQVPMRYALLDIMLPMAFTGVIVWQGLLLRGRLDATEARSVIRWFGGGMVLMGTLGLWPLVLDHAGQATVPVGVRLLTELSAGGLFGLLVGIFGVRARAAAEHATEARVERQSLERQRRTNELLNRTLRHQLLNSLTVVRGRAELLAERSTADRAEWARTVVEHTDAMAETVDEIAHITRSLTAGTELGPVDLQPVVEAQVRNVRAAFPGAVVTVDGVTTCQVRGDDLLGRALWNVLHNAVEHNESPRPTVCVDARVDDERAVVTVSDDGPGIPSGARERVLDANERGLGSDGDGLGLFLTASVLRQYGGDVTLAGSDLGGTAVELSLPLADRESPAAALGSAPGVAEVAPLDGEVSPSL